VSLPRGRVLVGQGGLSTGPRGAEAAGRVPQRKRWHQGVPVRGAVGQMEAGRSQWQENVRQWA